MLDATGARRAPPMDDVARRSGRLRRSTTRKPGPCAPGRFLYHVPFFSLLVWLSKSIVGVVFLFGLARILARVLAV